MDAASRILESLPPETVAAGLLLEPAAARTVAAACEKRGLRCSLHAAPGPLLAAVESGDLHLLFFEAQRVADPAAFVEAAKAHAPDLGIVLLAPVPPGPATPLPPGIDHFLLSPPSGKQLTALLTDFLDTRRRLRALEAYSLMGRKREIIGEISSVGAHLKSITKLKDRNREFEDRIEELNVAKERLAAEIRAKDAELQAMRARLAAATDAEAERRREVDALRKELTSRAEDVRDGLDAMREVRDRLGRTLESLRDDPPGGRPAGPASAAGQSARVRELEARLESAGRIFDRILAALTTFVAADRPSLETAFDEIISALAEFTSV